MSQRVSHILFEPRTILLVLLLLCVAAAWLGVQETVQQACLGFYHDGHQVLRVVDPASGVQKGDRLRGIDGHPMADHDAVLRGMEQQGTLTFDVARHGRRFELPVTLGQHQNERKRVWVHGTGILVLMMSFLTMMLPHPERKRWGMLGLALLSAAIFSAYLVLIPQISPPTIRFLFWLFAVTLGLFSYLSLSRSGKQTLLRVSNLLIVLLIAIATSVELVYPVFHSGYDGLDAQWDSDIEKATITDIAIFGMSSAPAALAGIRVGDSIVAVDGHALSTDYVIAHRAWDERLEGRRQTTYQIQRGDSSEKINVQATWLPGTIQWVLLSRAMAVFAFLFVAHFVLWKMPLEPRAQVFVGLSYAFVALVRLLDQPPMAYWISTPVVEFFDLPVKVWLLVAATNGPAMFLHFFWIFPERKLWLSKYPGVVYLIYAPGLWVAVGFLLDIYQFGEATAVPWIRWVALAYFLLAMISMGQSHHSAQQRRIKKQVKFVFLAILSSTVLVVAGGLWSYNAIDQSWAGKTFIAAWGIIPVAFGYAIVKHRAMNINLIIRRSLIYTTISILVAAGWVVVYYGIFQWAFSIRQQRGMITLGMALGVGFLMPRIERNVRSVIDRTFFREDYDYQQTLREFSRALASVIDLEALLQMSVRELCEIMHVSRACILLLDPHEPIFKPAAWRGVTRVGLLQFRADGPFARLIQELGHPMTIEEIERYQRSGHIAAEELEGLLNFDAELCVPIVFQGMLKGIILLGPKLSEDAYSREDMSLLSTLADQAAITLENTRLYEAQWEQDRIKEELASAQRIQRAILPEADPEPEGLELASFFQPATEVGGDYYDYVELDDHRFAIAVGDVGGHGLDAGLMVSMAKSCLYTTTHQLSEHTTTEVEQIMHMMNDMVCEVRERLLMTFALAVINRRDGLLTLANAGHPFPYHLRASGHLESIEAGAYPLGVRRDVTYPYHQRPLEPGDLLIFYSDGIIEAANERDELMGFERFEDILRNAPRNTAAHYRDYILAELRRFCQGIPFVDDVTLIVVRYLGIQR